MDAVKEKTLDGVMVRGILIEAKKALNSETGEVYDTLGNAKFETSRGNVNISIVRYDTTMNGRVELPAFTKLLNASKGETWLVTVAAKPQRPKDDQDDPRYVNYTAIDAELLDDTHVTSPNRDSEF